MFYLALDPSVIFGHISGIEHLNETNFPSWKEHILNALVIMDLDCALREKARIPPPSDDENLLEKSKVYVIRRNGSVPTACLSSSRKA